MRIYIIGLLFLGIFFSCQNSLDESDYNLSTTIADLNIYALKMHLTSFPDGVTQSSYLTSINGNETTFSNSVYLSNNTQYTVYFSFNYNNKNQLVWAMSGDYLEFYNPSSELQTIQKLRKIPVAFKSTVSGEYSLVVDTKSLGFEITPISNITDLYNFDSLHFVSSLDNWQITPQNKMLPISDDFYIIITNLSPGQYLNFKFALGDLGLVYYSQDPQNPLSQNNKLLDAEVTTGSSLDPLETFITSESCIVKFNMIAQNYSITMNDMPNIGDGYYDSDFYGEAILTNTNASAPIQKVYYRKTSNGSYWGIDGSFKTNSGFIEGAGVQLILLFDETSKNYGLAGDFSLWSLPSITIHPSSTIEHMLILEASNPKLQVDGKNAIKDGVKLFPNLTNGMTSTNIQNKEVLLTYNLSALGYFRHGDIYEIFIPKMNGDLTNWDLGPARIIGFSWNADTNWGVVSNSNTTPINQSLPNTSNTNKLPANGFWISIN